MLSSHKQRAQLSFPGGSSLGALRAASLIIPRHDTADPQTKQPSSPPCSPKGLCSTPRLCFTPLQGLAKPGSHPSPCSLWCCGTQTPNSGSASQELLWGSPSPPCCSCWRKEAQGCSWGSSTPSTDQSGEGTRISVPVEDVDAEPSSLIFHDLWCVLQPNQGVFLTHPTLSSAWGVLTAAPTQLCTPLFMFTGNILAWMGEHIKDHCSCLFCLQVT